MKTFKGKYIREVWDWRLSDGNPILHAGFAGGNSWVVQIMSNKSPDGQSTLLEQHDTKVLVNIKKGVQDPGAVAKCYQWLHSVRDKYSRDHIEIRKPVAAAINAANEKLTKMNGDIVTAKKRRPELDADGYPPAEIMVMEQQFHYYLKKVNAEIKAAALEMNKAIKEAA